MTVMPNNALERTVKDRGPHPGCQPVVGWLCMRQAALWPAAQLGRSAARCGVDEQGGVCFRLKAKAHTVSHT